ncbi:MAG TPA: FAD-linked oxidase C-terminal domain-containing protein [Rhodocyclaceae bacterium]|nr:FAD-linked oxidase C-terminal domain-containing protein [Rhodocyclaceae bacterium]
MPQAPAHATRTPSALLQTLRDTFGTRCSTGDSVRLQHGRDESSLPPALPDAVVFAENADEVAAVVKACAAHGTPLIPYGAGSSLEGHLLAVEGGVSLDLAGMNRILAINPEDLTATVEPGVTRVALNTALKGSGLFFPIDPGADATIGGMAATRASGTNAVRYGTMRDNVLALKAVLADGREIRTGSRARKSSAGYDLTRLLVGSEGTLGVITEITVRLYPVPEAISAAVCHFPSVAAAVQCVIQTIQLGVPVARIELLDGLAIHAINRYSKLTMDEAPTLFFEFHGSPAGVAEQAQMVETLASEHGGAGFAWATRPEDRSKLWQARHDAYFACLQLAPGSRSLTTDVCVPISRLAECVGGAQEDIAAAGLVAPILGHVGDGNFHVLMLAEPDNAEQNARAARLSGAIVHRALALGGTCTGEHGVGLGKRKYMVEEHGAAALDAMRALKAALDPQNIMNPRKILPP